MSAGFSLAKMIKQYMQTWLPTRWYSSSPGVLYALWPLEFIFLAVASKRRRRQPVFLPPIPTVIVGNISVGGTGKTPFLIALVEYLQRRGLRPGVVSRGYGGQNQNVQLVSHQLSATEVGDEPWLIYCRTGVPLVVGHDRAHAARLLCEHSNVDIILSDDGLQHYRLGRHIEIALVDANRQFGNKHCLPLGPLREPIRRLNDVDFVLLSGVSSVVNHDHAHAFSLPDFGIDKAHSSLSVQPCYWQNVATGQQMSLAEFAVYSEQRSLVAVAGLANPQKFYDLLYALNLQFLTQSFADHHAFCAQDFAFLSSNDLCVMTSKDAVKCESMGLVNAWFLEIDMSLPDDFLHAFCQRLTTLGLELSPDLVLTRHDFNNR